jgi:hypothetical protein
LASSKLPSLGVEFADAVQQPRERQTSYGEREEKADGMRRPSQ